MSEQTENQKAATAQSRSRFARVRWLFGYFAKPLLLFAAGAAVIALLGLAQRVGWIKSGAGPAVATATQESSVEYICPMMCVPPMKEPGRCPVCAMELVPSDAGGASSDGRSIVIDPASRRIANIATVSARSMPLTRTIRAVGELQYDEGTLKTIVAYTAGRYEKLYVDFTGADVKKGETLASFYSPELYSAQVEYLLARQTASKASSKLPAVAKANQRLLRSSRQKLIELGMTELQVSDLERRGEANSRFDVVAPRSGTVINRMISEGDEVKAGQPILKLADLSNVWLMLELFPEDAAVVKYGQRVEASVESLPSEVLSGRVAFVNPEVNPQSRTVSVRVVVPNPGGKLRIGEFATATIEIPLATGSHLQLAVYDPDLADKWVSPRHPHVVSDEPGKCRVCGSTLVHASTLGFTDEPTAQAEAIVVPRDAVLMAAKHSVVYVETEPGRFEIRRVETGPTTKNGIVILKGLAKDEAVATRGNFLLDSQMQLAGNPSLIDPTRAAPPMKIIPGFTPEMLTEINKLPPDEAALAIKQGFCPIADTRLGEMGVPIAIDVNGQSIFVCCEGCRADLLQDPDKALKHLAELQAAAEKNESKTDGGSATDQMDLPPIGEIEDMDLPPIGEIEDPAKSGDGK
jgi:Cu(I)/Ag(I) efflux system membrane fusion protein